MLAVFATFAPNKRRRNRRQGCRKGGVQEARRSHVAFHVMRTRRFWKEKLGPPSNGFDARASRTVTTSIPLLTHQRDVAHFELCRNALKRFCGLHVPSHGALPVIGRETELKDRVSLPNYHPRLV